MTFREKLEKEHPWNIGREYQGGCKLCPATYGYDTLENQAIACSDERYPVGEYRCRVCWNREIPGTEEKEKENKPMKKTKAMLEEELDQKRAEIEELKKELVKAEKYKQYDDAAGEMKAMYDSFVNAGFNDDRAFTILMTMLQNQKAASNSWDSYLVKYLSMHRK